MGITKDTYNTLFNKKQFFDDYFNERMYRLILSLKQSYNVDELFNLIDESINITLQIIKQFNESIIQSEQNQKTKKNQTIYQIPKTEIFTSFTRRLFFWESITEGINRERLISPKAKIERQGSLYRCLAMMIGQCLLSKEQRKKVKERIRLEEENMKRLEEENMKRLEEENIRLEEENMKRLEEENKKKQKEEEEKQMIDSVNSFKECLIKNKLLQYITPRTVGANEYHPYNKRFNSLMSTLITSLKQTYSVDELNQLNKECRKLSEEITEQYNTKVKYYNESPRALFPIEREKDMSKIMSESLEIPKTEMFTIFMRRLFFIGDIVEGIRLNNLNPTYGIIYRPSGVISETSTMYKCITLLILICLPKEDQIQLQEENMHSGGNKHKRKKSKSKNKKSKSKNKKSKSKNKKSKSKNKRSKNKRTKRK